MTDKTTRSDQVSAEDFFASMGVCPHCGSTDGYFDLYKVLWFTCSVHKTMWAAVLGGWGDGTCEEQVHNYYAKGYDKYEVIGWPYRPLRVERDRPRLVKP